MATFDLETAIGLVPMYDGSSDTFDTFEDASRFLFELNPNHEAMLIKFLRTRLIGKARIGLPSNITSFTELINDIKRRCKEKLTPDRIIVELKSITSKDTQTICQKVEMLTEKLNLIYLELEFPEKIANDMAIKQGIETLKQKISNEETKMILKIGTFLTITDATQKVLENECEEINKNSYQFNTHGYSLNHEYPQRNNQLNYHFFPNLNQSLTTQTTPNNYSYRNNNNFSFYKRHHQLKNCSSQSQVNQRYNNREYNYSNSIQNRSNNMQCYYIRTEQNRNYEQFNNNNQLHKNHIYHQNDEDYRNTNQE